MNEQQLKDFGEKVDELGRDFIDHIRGAENYLDAVLLGIAELLELDKKHQTHPGVVSALDSAIEGLRHAAMDYYVSLK